MTPKQRRDSAAINFLFGSMLRVGAILIIGLAMFMSVESLMTALSIAALGLAVGVCGTVLHIAAVLLEKSADGSAA